MSLLLSISFPEERPRGHDRPAEGREDAQRDVQADEQVERDAEGEGHGGFKCLVAKGCARAEYERENSCHNENSATYPANGRCAWRWVCQVKHRRYFQCC